MEYRVLSVETLYSILDTCLGVVMSLLKGTVRGYDAGAGTAEVEIVGSHGQYVTVPVATDLDSKTVVAGKKCAVLSFDDRDSGDAFLVATYDDTYLMGSAPLDDHDHSGDTGDGGQLEVDEALLATGATTGHVLTVQADDTIAAEVPSYPKRATMWHDESIFTSGTIHREHDTNQNYATFTREADGAIGDTFTNGCYLRAGTYTLRLLGIIGAAYGICKWSLNGVEIASGQDWYAAAGVHNTIKSVANVSVASDGWHKLECEVTGKNGSASDYHILLTKFWFEPSSD